MLVLLATQSLTVRLERSKALTIMYNGFGMDAFVDFTQYVFTLHGPLTFQSASFALT